MDWVAFIANIMNRIPVERVLFPPRDNTKALEEFAASLKAPETAKEAPSGGKTTVTTLKPEEALHSTATEVITRQGLDPETMKWQLEETRAELWELEAHLKHYCKECGPEMSCCFKHSQNLVDICRETKSMTTDPIWDDIIKLGEEVKVKAHPDNIRTGKYFTEFPQLIVRVSELRKPIETKLIELSRPEITLEEAKALAAEEAAKRIEESWGKET